MIIKLVTETHIPLQAIETTANPQTTEQVEGAVVTQDMRKPNNDLPTIFSLQNSPTRASVKASPEQGVVRHFVERNNLPEPDHCSFDSTTKKITMHFRWDRTLRDLQEANTDIFNVGSWETGVDYWYEELIIEMLPSGTKAIALGTEVNLFNLEDKLPFQHSLPSNLFVRD